QADRASGREITAAETGRAPSAPAPTAEGQPGAAVAAAQRTQQEAAPDIAKAAEPTRVELAAPTPPPAPAPAAPAAPAPAVEADVRPAGAPRIAQAMVAADADSGWTQVSMAAAERRLGGPVAAVAGLAVEQVELMETQGQAVVRVTQRLNGGRTVELTQRSAAPVPAPARRERQAAELSRRDQPQAAGAAGAGNAGPSMARTEWRGYLITITGPVPADSLQLLLMRLRER
ncbi:MAG TPA: hypothetical protein VD793_06365, partial [Gemmatimonadales bacterium]|nr:hypothetical protein [Gemmatimonadales bacterium]